jgi:hypothetical protein
MGKPTNAQEMFSRKRDERRAIVRYRCRFEGQY